VQSFSSSNQSSNGSFGGTSFTLPPGTLKWTVNITSSTPFEEGFAIAYQISDISSLPSEQTWNFWKIIESPSNITTYELVIHQAKIAQVQVFDVVLVDNIEYRPVNHSIVAGSNNESYILVIEFPPFSRSLFYDPTMSLGVLVVPAGNSGGVDVALVAGVTAGGLLLAAALWGVLVLVIVLKNRRQSSVANQVTI